MKKGSFALRLFLYASLFSLVWLGGYVALSGFFTVSEPKNEPPVITVTPAERLPETSSAYWSVLAVVNGERDVTRFLLRYADFLADVLVFVDVPVNTKAELAAGGYEVLSVHNPELPKLFMISDLCSIFPEETWCLAAEEAGAVLLGERPAVCYILEESVFEELTQDIGGEVHFSSQIPVKEMIFKVFEHAVTNGTLRGEMVYLESYKDIDRVLYRELPGKAEAEEFRPDSARIAEMVEKYRSGQFGETAE